MPTPNGPTQTKWFSNGYQSALRDIATQLEQGGESAVRQWIANNIQDDPSYINPAEGGERNY